MVVSGPSIELVTWWNKLCEKGIAPDNVRRVIIDIDWTGEHPVLVHYETLCDKEMLSDDLIEVLQDTKPVDVAEDQLYPLYCDPL